MSLHKMFGRKQRVPQEFEGEEGSLLQENYNRMGQKSLLYKFCAVSGETEGIKQQNAILTSKLDEFKIKFANSQDLEKRYKELKADKKAASDLNKDLEKQVTHYHMKLQNQIALEEKCKAAEEERQKLVRKRRHLEQEIVELNKKFKDHEALENEYQKMKTENKSMKAERDAACQLRDALRGNIQELQKNKAK